MNFMEKFNELANRTLVPIANKLGNQRHLAAIRDGMEVAIPLSILGDRKSTRLNSSHSH